MWLTDQSWSFNVHIYELVFIIWGFSQSCQSSVSESTTLLPVCEANLEETALTVSGELSLLMSEHTVWGTFKRVMIPVWSVRSRFRWHLFKAATKLPASHCRRNGSLSEFYEEPLLGLLTFWVASFESSVNYTKLFLIFKPSKNERPKFQSL